MAIYTLGSKDYQTFGYNRKLWTGGILKIGNIVNDFLPPVERVTSKSENRAFRWLFGIVATQGSGRVSVLYPYSQQSSPKFKLKNVDFSHYPFVSLVAVPDLEDVQFLGWYDSVTYQLLEESENLIIPATKFQDVTGFIARFSDYEDDLGF